MEFYEKLRKLRKEHAMSQEEFAQQLNVSRQAVSKWESGQGFPETDKLLIIGNIFGVSIDYLLKSDGDETKISDSEPGYYVSRETAHGYLAMKRYGAKRIALGVAIMVLSLSFETFFEDDAIGTLAFFLCIAAGIAILVFQGFKPKHYEEIEKQPLVFDEAFLREFRAQCTAERKKYGIGIVAGILFIIAGFLCNVLFEDIFMLPSRYAASYPILWALGIATLIINGSAFISRDVIAKNKDHIKELRQEQKYSWVFGAGFLLAAALFFYLGMIENKWHPSWIVFPITALICTAISLWLNSKDQS